MSCDNLFYTGNSHTSVEVLIGYDVFFSIFRGNSVEMGVKGIEMS